MINPLHPSPIPARTRTLGVGNWPRQGAWEPPILESAIDCRKHVLPRSAEERLNSANGPKRKYDTSNTNTQMTKHTSPVILKGPGKLRVKTSNGSAAVHATFCRLSFLTNTGSHPSKSCETRDVNSSLPVNRHQELDLEAERGRNVKCSSMFLERPKKRPPKRANHLPLSQPPSTPSPSLAIALASFNTRLLIQLRLGRMCHSLGDPRGRHLGISGLQ